MLFALPTHMDVASVYTECCSVTDGGEGGERCSCLGEKGSGFCMNGLAKREHHGS